MTADSNRQLAIVRLSISCIVLRIVQALIRIASEFVDRQCPVLTHDAVHRD